MNNLGDLNMYLFEQMERLNNDELKGDELKNEIEKAKAVTMVAGKVIDTGKLVLEAQKFYDERFDTDKEMPKMLKE